jgi:hypothetical protein
MQAEESAALRSRLVPVQGDIERVVAGDEMRTHLAGHTNGPGPTGRWARSEGSHVMTDLSSFTKLVPLDNGLCVLSTTHGDGRIHSCVVNAGVLSHPLTATEVVGLVAAGGTRKLRNLRADPSATIVVRAGCGRRHSGVHHSSTGLRQHAGRLTSCLEVGAVDR